MRWRSSAVRAPPTSSPNRSESRSASCSTESVRTCAAASSIASGSPSKRRQMAVTASLGVKSGRARRARSTNSVSASAPVSGGTRQSVSPSTRSVARLVASTETPGAALSTVAASSAHASARCSQLSSAISAVRGARYWHTACVSVMPGSGRTPSASATAAPTSACSVSGASWTQHTSSCRDAACNASRVFPHPPGPVTVSIRVVPRACSSARSSCSRPTKLVSATGRLFDARMGRRTVLLH